MIASLNAQKRTILACLLSCPSHYVFLICFLIGGVVLWLGSFALGIADLEATGSPYSCKQGAMCGQRQIGFLWAPNWSLTYAILGPLALLLMLEALKGIRDALDSVFQAEMVRDEHMEPIRVCLSSCAWKAGTRARSWFLAICAGLVPALLAYPEWWVHNLMRLKAGSCQACNPSDYDWGLAAIIRGWGGGPGWPENAAFDFLAFTCEAFLLGAAILCFLYLLDLRQVLPGPESRVNGFLWPNIRSNDPRRGFQEFEEPLQLMLYACLTFFLICYSIRINRIYMRSVGYSSIIDFIQSDIMSLVKNKIVELKGSELLGVLLTTPSEAKYQEFFAGTALMLISLFSLSVIIMTVSGAARRAKKRALMYYEGRDQGGLFGLELNEERARAKKMTTWPLDWRYFQLNALLAINIIALFSLYYYRIGLYIVVVVIAALLTRVRKAVGP